MIIKRYKKIYSIYKGYGSPTIQVHLVRETKKTYLDITSIVGRCHKEKGTYPWNGFYRCFGYKLPKENEYQFLPNNYSVYMYGSDLEKLKEAWLKATTPIDEEGLEFNSNSTDIMVSKLNNQEETETGKEEDN